MAAQLSCSAGLAEAGDVSPGPLSAEMRRVTEGSVANPAIEAVLSTLERLVADLRHRTEEAESRAAAADERAELERQAREAEAAARRDAEIRAAVAEQRANDAEQRAQAIGASTAERIDQLGRELLSASRAAIDAAQNAAAAVRTGQQDRHRVLEAAYPVPSDGAQARSSHARSGTSEAQAYSSQAPARRWDDDSGYAWVEDEPGPSWWRRLFKRRG